MTELVHPLMISSSMMVEAHEAATADGPVVEKSISSLPLDERLTALTRLLLAVESQVCDIIKASEPSESKKMFDAVSRLQYYAGDSWLKRQSRRPGRMY